MYAEISINCDRIYAQRGGSTPESWVQTPRPRRCCLTWTTCRRSRPPPTHVALAAASRRAAADATERSLARAVLPAGRRARPPPPPEAGARPPSRWPSGRFRWLSPRVGGGHRPTAVRSLLPSASGACGARGACGIAGSCGSRGPRGGSPPRQCAWRCASCHSSRYPFSPSRWSSSRRCTPQSLRTLALPIDTDPDPNPNPGPLTPTQIPTRAFLPSLACTYDASSPYASEPRIAIAYVALCALALAVRLGLIY